MGSLIINGRQIEEMNPFPTVTEINELFLQILLTLLLFLISKKITMREKEWEIGCWVGREWKDVLNEMWEGKEYYQNTAYENFEKW